MGTVYIHPETTKNPLSLTGEMAGLCWGANTSDPEKNFNRGLDCLRSDHGRTLEFAQVYLILEGWSAKLIRELYTHIGSNPTRLQASTRYINYKDFPYVVPPKVANNDKAAELWDDTMEVISDSMERLESYGVPREDASQVLPLTMETKIVLRDNLRSLITMSRKRMCNRAYHEFRDLMREIIKALSEYSDEWKYLIEEEKVFAPQCEVLGYCPEAHSCGKKVLTKEEFNYAIGLYTTIKDKSWDIDGKKVRPICQTDYDMIAEWWKERVQMFAGLIGQMDALHMNEEDISD